MKNILSICEFISKMGGIRLYKNDVATLGSGELRDMGAVHWHKAAPFRAKLVRDDPGKCPDDMALAVFDAGYFGRGGERPDVNALLDAIGAELSGHAIYTPEDEMTILNAENAAHEVAHVEAQCAATMKNLASIAATQAGRVIPKNSVAVTGLFDAVVYLYAVPYVTKKGRHGESLYAKAFLAGSTKPAFHKVFASAGERDKMVQEFLQGELV